MNFFKNFSEIFLSQKNIKNKNERYFLKIFFYKKIQKVFLDSESDMTGAGNDENGEGMNKSIIESATREHVYTGFVDPRKCSTCFYRNI